MTQTNDSSSELETLQRRVATQQDELLKAKAALDDWVTNSRIFQMVAEHVADLVAVVDLSGTRIWNNSTFFHTLGYEPEELKSTSSFGQIHPNDLDKVKRIFEETVKTGIGRSVEYRMGHKSGTWVPLESNAEVVKDDEGNPECIVVVSRDISKRKQLEEEMIKAGKIEAIYDMAAHLSRDLKDVLKTVDLYMGENALAISRGSSGTQLGQARQRLRSIVEGLHRFADTSEQDPSTAKGIYLEKFVRTFVDKMLRNTAVRAEQWFATGLYPAKVTSNALGIVLEQILQNSIDATHGRGVVRIEVSNTHYDPSTSPRALSLPIGRYVIIEVRDQGHGIKPESLPKVFSPFFTTKKAAAGLGLTTALSLVQQWGGTIIMESEEGAGTTTTIFIPAVVPASQASPEPETVFKIQPKKILFMDDQVMIIQFVQELLQLKGHSVTTAKDGKTALALYQESLKNGVPFDLVILDLVVPQGQGAIETLELLKQMDPNVVCVVSSGKTHHPAMARWKDYGFSAALEKPYDADRIDALISKFSHAKIASA